jgi:hypothetical protein
MSKNVKVVMCENTYPHSSDRVFELKVYIGDEYIGGGSYGGEPEDNTHYRDYKWVQQLVLNLLFRLDCSVTEDTQQCDY